MHEWLGHPGSNKLANTVKTIAKVKSLNKKVIALTRDCLVCQTQKSHSVKQDYDMGQITARKPFQKIAIDLIGPISTAHYAQEQNPEKWILVVIVDVYSWWTSIILTQSTSARKILEILKTGWFDKFGYPKELISDQGRQFIANEFTVYLRMKCIRHILTSPYNPTGNSIVERVNQTIGNVLRCSKEANLHQVIDRCIWSLNLAHHSTLGTSPYAVVYGQNFFNRDLAITITADMLRTRKFKQTLSKTNPFKGE